MTVGVGGSITQTILEDKNDARIWDHANAKLINIQLLNSATFEHLTGMATPKTPISYSTYASSKLPFYELYNEQPSAAHGQFSKLKTISEVDALQTQTEISEFDPLRPSLCSKCKLSFANSG